MAQYEVVVAFEDHQVGDKIELTDEQLAATPFDSVKLSTDEPADVEAAAEAKEEAAEAAAESTEPADQEDSVA